MNPQLIIDCLWHYYYVSTKVITSIKLRELTTKEIVTKSKSVIRYPE